MVFTKKLVLFLSSLLWIVSGAMAQSALSLRDAISLGLERNYDIRIERKNVEVAENNNSWGEAVRLPTVTLNATLNNTLTYTASGDQFFNGQTFPGFELNRQINSTIAPTLNLNWNIFDGNRANISKARLADLQAESEGNAQIVVANTVQAIILAYYIAVLEEERLGSFKTQLELSRDRFINMQVGAELGTP